MQVNNVSLTLSVGVEWTSSLFMCLKAAQAVLKCLRDKVYIFLLCSCFSVFLSLKDMEGYLKTDDRMRLAKERREERERSLGKCL